MGEKRLSEVINFEIHIEPYQIIEIVSGVGSGKNYWVENVLMEKYRVLLITSRKAKVEETQARANISKCLRLSHFEENELNYSWFAEKNYGSCVCNNWQIEHYMKNIYNRDDSKTYLSNYFDIIVIDEAHSLVTDATFCDAPFYVYDFIRSTYNTSKVKIILMTATYNPIKKLIPLKKSQNYTCWDFTEECINIKPTNIILDSKEETLNTIVDDYNNHMDNKWHLVYFVARTRSIYQDIIPFLVERGIPEEVIAVSFSDDEAKCNFSETILSNKERSEAYMANHEDLPEDIKIFISTTRNKEGINLNNNDFLWDIVIESHWKDEVMQMWGRIRSGLNKTTLVYDAVQHPQKDVMFSFDYGFDFKHIKEINLTFDKWCVIHDIYDKNRYHNEMAKKQIDYIASTKFPYLRYSTYNNKFVLYKGRIEGEKQYYNDNQNFNSFFENEMYLNEKNLKFFFKDIPIKFNEAKNKIILFEEYINSKGYLDRPITKAEKEDLLKYITLTLNIKQKDNGKPYKYLSKPLKFLGYKLKEKGKNKVDKSYGTYILEKITGEI